MQKCRDAEVQGSTCAYELQICRSAEVQRCRMQDMMEMQKFRSRGINLVRRRGADEVQRCRGAECKI